MLANENSAVVTTLAGNGTRGSTDGVGTLATFFYSLGVSLDGAGGLYVADSFNSVIRRVDLATRAVTTVAGIVGNNSNVKGATPLQSTFNRPFGVEADIAGNV